MKWEEFSAAVQQLPYFNESVLDPEKQRRAVLRNQFSGWVKNGRLWRLRKGLYTLPVTERRVGLSLRLASNAIYSPSYLSLEYMLSFYGLIPEGVTAVTAVTTLKTANFKNRLAVFSYRHLKRRVFSGFIAKLDEFGFPVLLASPEKALLDKLYLDAKTEVSENYLQNNLRLQNTQLLQTKRLKQLVTLFASAKLERTVKIILRLKKMEK